MKRELFDIWETEPDRQVFRWHVQMVNYVARVPSKEAAEKLVAATMRCREQEAKKIKTK